MNHNPGGRRLGLLRPINFAEFPARGFAIRQKCHVLSYDEFKTAIDLQLPVFTALEESPTTSKYKRNFVSSAMCRSASERPGKRLCCKEYYIGVDLP
jgi:hypothetical protein